MDKTPVAATQQKSQSNNNNQSGSSSTGGGVFKPMLLSLLLSGAIGAGVIYYYNDSLKALEEQHSAQSKQVEQIKKELEAKKIEQEQSKSSINSELETLEQSHAAKIQKLKDSFNSEMEQLQKLLKQLQERSVAVEQEKKALSESLDKNLKKERELLAERENLLSQKKQLEEQLHSVSSLKVRSSESILNDVLGREVREGDILTEEDRDIFLSRVQRLEAQLERKEKSIESIKTLNETQIQRMKEMSEEKLATMKREYEEKAASLQKEMEALQKKHDEEVERERKAMIDNLDAKLQQQAHELLIKFYDGALDRSKQVQEMTHKVYAMEEVYGIAAANFTNNIDLQKLTATIFSLQESIQNGAPFKPEMDTLKQLSETDDLIKAVVDTVPVTISKNGVSKLDDLVERFKIVKKKAIESSLVPVTGGLFGYLYSKLVSAAVVAEEGFVDGESVNAILSRTEFYLKQRRLLDAVNEINKCQNLKNENVNLVLRDWIAEAHNRLLVDEALQTLISHLIIQSHSIKSQ